jgi:hypothetical protein
VSACVEEQLLRVEGEFKRTFSDAGPDTSPAVKKLLSELSPAISGRVVFYAGISSAMTTDSPSGTELRLRVLPVFHSIEVDEVVVAKKAAVTAAGDVLTSVLNRYAANIGRTRALAADGSHGSGGVTG